MINHEAILAKLAELRGTAEAAKHGGEGRWHQPSPDSYHGRIEDERGEVVTYDEGAPTESEAEHIATWNPAFALCWIEWAEDVAKRHAPIPYYDQNGQGWACSYEWADSDGWRIDWRKCPHVAGLARALGPEET